MTDGPKQREEARIDAYTEVQESLRGLGQRFYAPESAQDPAALHCLLDPILEHAARNLVGSELTAVISYVEQFFNKDAKFYAVARLREYEHIQPALDISFLPAASTNNGHDRVEPNKPLHSYDCGQLIDTYPTNPNQVLRGVFDAGDKVCVIAASKSRKSFFALQLALCLAVGREFLGFMPDRPYRVFLCQNEINHIHFHKRLRDLAITLGIRRPLIEQNFHYANTRGVDVDVEMITKLPIELKSEVIIFDPLYKMLSGDENLAKDFKPLLAEFDKVAQQLQAAVVYIHHDAKGAPGSRLLADRGAGSGVLARDYDSAFFLTPQRDEEETWVMETLLRNYAPVDPRCITWEDGAFRKSDAPVVLQTASKRSISEAGKKPPAVLYDHALRLLLDGPIVASKFRDLLSKKLGIPQQKGREVYALINKSDEVVIVRSGENKRTKVIELTAGARYRLEHWEDEELAEKARSYLEKISKDQVLL